MVEAAPRPFLFRRWHRVGDGWSIYRATDTGNDTFVDTEIIATSNEKWDTIRGRTNKLFLQRDIQEGWVELLGLEERLHTSQKPQEGSSDG